MPAAKPGAYTGSAMRSSGTALSSKLAAQSPKLARPNLPSRSGPSSGRPAPSAPPKAPPKKGSFAEILARGQRAQVSMGQVGKIQHKKVEKALVKRPQPDAPGPKAGLGKNKSVASRAYTGTSKSIARNGVNGHKTSTLAGRQDARPMGKSKAKAAAEEEEASKKVKKAAQATTGYTGTARPKPGMTRKKDAPRGGALLNTSRPAASSRSRYEDDYDEELDDFIEYDDDEDEGGPRHGYASDGSSDMEAGLDDIDLEERRADYIGRREDQEEERIERSLKQVKEERKRKALEALRAHRR